MSLRGNRDEMVIATKYTSFYPSHKGGEKIQGNNFNSMHISLEASLKKLDTINVSLIHKSSHVPTRTCDKSAPSVHKAH
ncbi:hypothetical protein V1520DRAFT_357293 [Lipomyces starkeyi]|uniref:NADP-dependent oxidoreductase domain-containing protein n=1 Tax=Lipomyces starkeyi NRRL Y-11557 TaxID=675824 RepID=A0A1E3Q6P3_LIPST|nr:hypothetical protein LIPSTDRAFT_104929 [Lipomyces starkeyi NRRL Y-11557]